MIRYLFIDVDGTLTDGGIYYDNTGNELKKFSTKDGTGIILIRAAGIIPIILTGRECHTTTKRMTELGVSEIYQNVKNKAKWVKCWIKQNNIKREKIGYIGDDLNDLGAMKLCGFVACPADAIEEVKETSNYIATVEGGHGVVRDVIKYYLLENGKWTELINSVYNAGI